MRRIARKDAGVRRRAERKAPKVSHIEPLAAETERGRSDFLDRAGLLQLQGTAGNAAVTALLRSVALGAGPSGPHMGAGPSGIARSLTQDLLRGRMPGAEVAAVEVTSSESHATDTVPEGVKDRGPVDTTSVSRFVEPIGGQQPPFGSGGTFDWDVEAKLQYPSQTDVDVIKFGKDEPERPFGQVLVPEQDPQFATRGSGRGQVRWNLAMKWDFGARLSQAAIAGSAIPTTAGFIPAPTPNMAGGPEVALGAGQLAKGEAHVTVVAPFNVQHAAYDKPLSGSAKQRNQSEQGGAAGGPMRSDRSKIGVVWGQPRTTEMSSVGKGGQLIGAPGQTDSSDDGGSVTIAPQLMMQSQVAEAAQGSTATSAGILGFGSQSQTSAQFQQQMNDTQAMTRSFTADVKVPPPETLAPKTKFEGVSAAVGPFGVDSDRLPTNAEENISEWYLGEKAFDGPEGTQPAISSGARELIEAGQVEIRVTGHASATASFAHNRDLSRRRADKVTSILKDLAGSDIKVNQRALGKAKTRTKAGAPKEDPAERRVQIEYQADVPDDPNMAHTGNASDVENG